MKILSLLLCILFLTSNCAVAQYANIEGKFKSKMTELNLIALDSESGVIAASTTVVLGPCSGSIAGLGKMGGNVLTFSPYAKVTPEDKCVVTVAFDAKRNTAQISGKSCGAYHGASCGWEGDTIKRAK